MKALVVIPTYNERENIEGLIPQVLDVSDSIDILVVDDNSPDGTAQYVGSLANSSPRVHLLRRSTKLGLGSAYIEGFKYALERGYDCVIEMDADFSHDPKDIPRFLEMIQHYDLVIGSRYMDGVSVVNWPISRLLLSYFANLYARIVTGIPIRDLTSGFKCLKSRLLKEIDLDRVMSDGYGFQIEMNFLFHIHGARIVEIPIIFIERRSGVSKMSKRIVWEAFWLVWRLRLRKMTSKK